MQAPNEAGGANTPVTTIRKGNDEIHFRQVHEYAKAVVNKPGPAADQHDHSWVAWERTHNGPVEAGIFVPDQKGHIDQMNVEVTGDLIPGIRIAYHPVCILYRVCDVLIEAASVCA